MGEENEHSSSPYDRSGVKSKHGGCSSYKQTYRKAWEELPDFKGWLTADPEGNKSRAYCIVCNKTLHAHRISLLKHTVSLKHTKAFQSFATSSTSTSSGVTYSSDALQKAAESALILDFQSDSDELDDPLKVNLNATSERDCSNDRGIPDVEGINVVVVDTSQQHFLGADNLQQGRILNRTEMAAEVTQPAAPEINDVPVAQSSPITTHVLDLTRGLPVSNLAVSLYQLVEGRWTHISDDVTNGDGRAVSLLVKPKELKPGRYKLHFDTEKYYSIRNVSPLYPFIEITFDVRSPQEHYHIPLLMTGFGYTTYRGS